MSLMFPLTSVPSIFKDARDFYTLLCRVSKQLHVVHSFFLMQYQCDCTIIHLTDYTHVLQLSTNKLPPLDETIEISQVSFPLDQSVT